MNYNEPLAEPERNFYFIDGTKGKPGRKKVPTPCHLRCDDELLEAGNFAKLQISLRPDSYISAVHVMLQVLSATPVVFTNMRKEVPRKLQPLSQVLQRQGDADARFSLSLISTQFPFRII